MTLHRLLQRRCSFNAIRLQYVVRTFHNLNMPSSPIPEPVNSTSNNFREENVAPTPFGNSSPDQLSSNLFSSSTFSFNPSPPTRSYGFLSAEEAAAERRRRKRRLRIEPPIQMGQRPPPPPRDPRQPDSTSALTGPRLNLHNRVQSLIRAFDLDAASNLARSAVYGRTRPTVFTCNAIIAAMHRATRYEDSKSLFKYFFEQNNLVPNVVSYNYLINSLCDEGNVDEALAVYRRIIAEAPFGPSHVTFRHLTKGLIDAGRIEEAVDLLREMLNKGHGADSLVYNNLIKGYLNMKNLERADEFFNELKERCLVYDGVVNATYMEWWFEQGKEKEAMDSYKSLLDKKYRMVPATCNVLLGVLVKYGKKEHAWDLFEHMLDDHTPPTFQAVNSETFSIMVNECFKEGKISEAIETFRRSGTKERSRPFAMDVAGYNNMIARFCEIDMVSEAEKYFDELCSKSLNPDVTSFRTLIDAFLRLERIDDGLRYFTKMVDAGLRVVASYGIVVFEKLIANGKVTESFKILTTMGEKDPKPDSSIYDVVVRGVCNAGDLDASREILNQMMSYGISLPPPLKEFLKSIFQGAGRGDEIESILDENKWRAALGSHQASRQPRFQPGSSQSSPFVRKIPPSQPSWPSSAQPTPSWSSQDSGRLPYYQGGGQQTWSPHSPSGGLQQVSSSHVGVQNTYQPSPFGEQLSSQQHETGKQNSSWSQMSDSNRTNFGMNHVSTQHSSLPKQAEPREINVGMNSAPQQQRASWPNGEHQFRSGMNAVNSNSTTFDDCWNKSHSTDFKTNAVSPQHSSVPLQAEPRATNAGINPVSKPVSPWQHQREIPQQSNGGMNAVNAYGTTWDECWNKYHSPDFKTNSVSPQHSSVPQQAEPHATNAGINSVPKPRLPWLQRERPQQGNGGINTVNSNGITWDKYSSPDFKTNTLSPQHSSSVPQQAESCETNARINSVPKPASPWLQHLGAQQSNGGMNAVNSQNSSWQQPVGRHTPGIGMNTAPLPHSAWSQHGETHQSKFVVRETTWHEPSRHQRSEPYQANTERPVGEPHQSKIGIDSVYPQASSQPRQREMFQMKEHTPSNHVNGNQHGQFTEKRRLESNTLPNSEFHASRPSQLSGGGPSGSSQDSGQSSFQYISSPGHYDPNASSHGQRFYQPFKSSGYQYPNRTSQGSGQQTYGWQYNNRQGYDGVSETNEQPSLEGTLRQQVANRL